MVEYPLPPGSTIGIFGGGQLGRMLVLAAAQLGFKTHIFCPETDAPAFDVATARTIANYADEEAIRSFARHVDVITFEFENVPASSLLLATDKVKVEPAPNTLEIIQDRLCEKEFLRKLAIPVAKFTSVDAEEEMSSAAARIGRPAMLKTRRFGYDGKGQVKIDQASDLSAAYNSIKGAPALMEAFVPFKKEVSIITVRSMSGEMLFYDLSENIHKNQILNSCQVPADIPLETSEAARVMAGRIAQALEYIGVLAVEMFYCGEDSETPLLVNEIAPRVHNTGHWTLDACLISQFENHIRAIAGWPLGATTRHSDAMMVNLIGEAAEVWQGFSEDANVALHLYGKREIRQGRKMGHLTRISPKAR